MREGGRKEERGEGRETARGGGETEWEGKGLQMISGTIPSDLSCSYTQAELGPR